MKKNMHRIKVSTVVVSLLMVFAVLFAVPTVYASTTIEDVTVTFVSSGKGSISGPQTIKVASGSVPHAVPTANPFKECFFTGWVDENGNVVNPLETPVNDNTTFTATFGEPFAVKYLSSGKGSISGPQTVKVAPGGKPNAIPTANPFKECFFTGWVDESGNPVNPLDEVIDENRLFTATFGEPFAVKYLSSGKGSISGPQTVKVAPGGKPNAIPTANPFKECFFTGWVDESGNPVNPLDEVIDENRLFTATFGEPFAVKFYSVGKGSISGPQTIKVLPDGTPHILPTTIPFKGYRFEGWVDEDGYAVDPLTEVISSNRIFYATFGQELASN